jgi:hypothetical protein
VKFHHKKNGKWNVCYQQENHRKLYGVERFAGNVIFVLAKDNLQQESLQDTEIHNFSLSRLYFLAIAVRSL